MHSQYLNTSGLHNGIDLGVSAGTNVLAQISGRVVSLPQYQDASPNVYVQTDDGYIVTFGHVNSSLQPGTVIKPDTVIGTVIEQTIRTKGDNSHLHISVWKIQENESVRFYNPLLFFKQLTIDTYAWGPYKTGESSLSMKSFQSGTSDWWSKGDTESNSVWR